MSKTVEVTQYRLSELKELFPEGYETAIGDERERISNDGYCLWSDEIMDSLEAIIEAMGFVPHKWRIGPYDRAELMVRFRSSDACDVSGRRAIAWIENHLEPFRAKFVSVLSAHYALPFYKENRVYNKPGSLKACPFTGVCFDEDFIDALRKDVKSGTSIKDAIGHLATDAQRMMEAECEYQSSEEAIFEKLADDWFLENGDMV
jgi:hypothetical protein